MSNLRPAVIGEYLTWLSQWLNAGNQPTHAYDYPWDRDRWFTATHDFALGDECGADAVRIIVPAGINHAHGGLGHNTLYYLDGPRLQGHFVPVFSDPQFLYLPGMPEFIREEQRKLADWWRENREREASRLHAAEGSDVPSRFSPSREETTT